MRTRPCSRAAGRAASWLILSACAGTLGGCANPDHVLFVTQTAIGVGADTTSGSGHIGYDRTEAYIGPAYPKSGGLPPVAAALQSDLALFAPAVKQYYATGDAALVATGRIDAPSRPGTGDLSEKERCALNQGCAWTNEDDRRLSVVGTNTHVGLVLKTKDANLAMIDFGYGRQEASLLPLLKGANDTGDIYPSTFASISVDTTTNGGDLGSGTGLKLGQFIATGAAATSLAATPGVRKSFGGIADAAAAQQQLSLAQTFGVSADQANNIVAAQRAGFVTVQARAGALVQTLLGAPPDTDRALTTDDVAKLKSAVDKLPGDAGDTSTMRGRAMALTQQKTAAEVRTWLVQRTDVLAALEKSSGA